MGVVFVLKSISLTWLGRVALSLAALLAGCATCAAAVVLCSSRRSDEAALVAVDLLIFAMAAWLVTMLPISLLVGPHSVVCRALFAPLFGGLCGLIAFAIEVAALMRGMLMYEPWLYVWAFWIGASAWSLYAWLLRHSFRELPS